MSSDATADSPQPGVSRRATLRQVTVVLPETGEHAHRKVTLRKLTPGGLRPNNQDNASTQHDERTPLLPTATSPAATTVKTRLEIFRDKAREQIKAAPGQLWAFLQSRDGKNVLKCSFAYLIATMAVFVPWFSKILGSSDSKHIVTNIIVWYNPARSAGSMEQGMIYALLAFCFASVVSYASMATATLARHGGFLSPYGHAIVLVTFCGGSLGIMSWVKQRMNDPLVNVSISLASIPIVIMSTKEPAIHYGFISHTLISQILRMAVMGIIISTLVTILIWPIRARVSLRENLVKATNLFAETLSSTTISFLSGNKDEMGDSNSMTRAVSGLGPNLTEARNEHYLLGTEREFHLLKRLVNCIQELSQDIGGLRAAASTQFDLLSEPAPESSVPTPWPGTALATPLTESQASIKKSPECATHPLQSIPSTPDSQNAAVPNSYGSPGSLDSFKSVVTIIGDQSGGAVQPSSVLRSLDEDLNAQGEDAQGGVAHGEAFSGASAASAADIFNTFVEHLGPHMKSLAYTLKTILSELPFGPGPTFAIQNHANFRPSLVDAIKIFSENRREALAVVYKSKEVALARSIEVAADFEEVAASCGYFASSLQDLAENVLKYLDILDDLEEEINERSRGRSWDWLKFWRLASTGHHGLPINNVQLNMSDWLKDMDKFWLKLMIKPSTISPQTVPKTESSLSSSVDMKTSMPAYVASFQSTFRYKLWRSLRMFRRDDVRFAIKVGAGGAVYASLAFIPQTQPYFFLWRLEWSMATYFFVCSMTIGAANTTIFARILGTCMGAGLAIVVWLIGNDNPVILALLGWIVSLGVFYIVVVKNQGPMGRFILLTYNLSVLYSYSLSVNDQDKDDDEGGTHPLIYEIVRHRLIAILIGITYGLFITRAVWPISARKKLKNGLSLIWLRMGLIWKRGPLTIMQYPDPVEDRPTMPSYMRITEELRLREFADLLETMRKNAESEFTLRRPFQSESYTAILKSTGRILDSFHALNVIMTKDLKASPGEAALLRYTAKERDQLARRISHLLSVLASSMKLEYPLTDTLPDVIHTRDRLLAKVFAFRQDPNKTVHAEDDDFEILYCYVLVTGQIAKEINVAGAELQKLYGVLDENILKLE